MLPVVTSARGPIFSVLPVILLTKNASQRVQLLCKSRKSGHEISVPPPSPRGCSAYGEQPILMGYCRIRTEQDPFDPTKYGSISADSQGQAQNCQTRKAWRPEQLSEPISQILNQIFKDASPACVPALLFDLGSSHPVRVALSSALLRRHAWVFGNVLL